MQALQQAHQTTKNINNSDNVKPFAPRLVGKACMAKKIQTLDIADIWFFDLCTSRHLCNNRKLFWNTKTKNINFVTTIGQIIQTKDIGTILILLARGNTIELHNVTLAPEYDFNLISLGKLRKSGMTYHNNPTTIILMKDQNIIAEAKKKQNLFTLGLAYPEKVMAIISP